MLKNSKNEKIPFRGAKRGLADVSRARCRALVGRLASARLGAAGGDAPRLLPGRGNGDGDEIFTGPSSPPPLPDLGGGAANGAW